MIKKNTLILITILILLSLSIYSIQIKIFNQESNTLFYLFQDLAFVPIQVLLVTLLLNRLLNIMELRKKTKKINVIISTFFVETGTELLTEMAGLNNNNDEIYKIMKKPRKDHGRSLKKDLDNLNYDLIITDGKELFWSYLFDSRPEISKSAYLCIKGNSIKYGAEILFYEYKNCDIYHIKRYLAMLLMNENSWERLPYLMDIYFDRELVDLQIKMENKITNRSMYSSIGSDKVELIKKVMLEKQNMFREDILKGIYFDLKQLQGDKTNGF